METKPNELKEGRRRKFLLLLPLFVYPFLTLLLWSTGLLGSEKVQAQADLKQGLNVNLPDAMPREDKGWNKLSFYEQADKDAARWEEQVRNDPYFKMPGNSPALDTPSFKASSNRVALSYDTAPGKYDADANAAKVYDKIGQLNKQLESNVASSKQADTPDHNTMVTPAVMPGTDVDRLENLLQAMDKGKEEDPELQQLNGMLERILDIQHPQRVQERLKETSIAHKGQVLPVSLQEEEAVTVLQPARKVFMADTARQIDSIVYVAPANGFYALNEEGAISENNVNAIQAVVQETQTIVPGATVKFRLLNDVYINGTRIPAGHFVYGLASLAGERLEVAIKTVGYGSHIFPVALSVFDVDGMEGMYMPGAITRDVVKESTDQTLQSIGLSSLDPSIGAQAASAGINATKNLLSKKVKLIKVTVKAGYRVLLRDGNNK